MFTKTLSCGLIGLEGFPVHVEVDLSAGLPAVDIVGLPDAAVKESKERVRLAIQNSGYDFPVTRITINLAPADKRKEGPVYDLAIAVGILATSGQIKCEKTRDALFLGELSLDGMVRPINGVLPMAIDAHKNGVETIVLPAQNVQEAAGIKGLNIIGVESLKQVVEHFSGKTPIDAAEFIEYGSCEDVFPEVDFSDIKGQRDVKRAVEIAVAGGHNILLIGAPGSGKTMIAKSIPTILPDLTFEEALEVTKIHSVCGELKNTEGIISKRPFRGPHHSVSTVALVSGGSKAMPGEVSLAHNGVLFLDELPEFSRHSLEALRQPMEDAQVSIVRVKANATYPANFMMVASMNPCPCGNYGSGEGSCRCAPGQINRYLARISGPLLDRIDMHIEVDKPTYSELSRSDGEESSAQIKDRINTARNLQIDRYKDSAIYCNAQLKGSMVKKYCKLEPDAQELIKNAFDRLGLSARSYTRILMVSRTIADLEGCENIGLDHVAEAIQHRTLDRKYWGSNI